MTIAPAVSRTAKPDPLSLQRVQEMHAAYLHGLDQTARDALDKQEPKLDSCIVAAIVSPVASYIGRRQQLATSASPDDVSELLKFADTLRASMDGDIRPLSELGAKEAPMVKKWLEVAVVQATSLLNDDHERAISKLVSEAPADRPDTFDDQLFQGQDRVYFQLPKPESKIAAEIEGHLIAGGYKDMDYQAGTVINPQGPITKIGRALQRVGQMELRDAYAKDPARASDMIVMISRDPEDIARMSTKRKWDSCMNPSHYRFGRHVTADLQEGTAIAYLLKPNDVNAVNPIARIALKPYRNEEGEVLMVPNRTFGLTRTPFADFVRDVADTYVNEGKTGVFKIHHDLGTDDLASEVERFPDGRIVSEITLEPNIQAGEPVRKLPDGTTAKRGMRVAI